MTGNGRLDMLAVPMECEGLSSRDFSLPPFRVEASQKVCLHVPLSMAIWYETLLPILSGRLAHPAMHLHGSVSYLERPMPRRRWWGGWRRPYAGEWLTAEKGLTSSEAEAVLNLVGEPADMSVGRIGWRERTLLALEATMFRPPDRLVFDTCGNDLDTIYHIFDRLASRTPQFALVYLKTRLEPEDPCLPGAVCLEVVRAGTLATIAE
jgi:hypothetical protein